MKFRIDINGLRAIAVISVLLYHFDIPYFQGGFVGVDVFFVISGFLMTGIIMKNIESKNFSFVSFYVARANRIFPPLVFLLLFLSVYGYFYLYSIDYKDLGKYITASSLFLSNILLSSSVDYFSPNASGNWLLHTWSLSVEWQFYVIYPLILVFAYRTNIIKYAIVLLILLSFIYSVYSSIYTPNQAYFSIASRSWELLVGGIGYWIFRENYAKIKIIRRSIHNVGLILIVISIIGVNKNDYWPGYFALFPVIGSLFIIVSNYQSGIVSNTVFHWVGKSSYSIYLWHWPLVVFIYHNNQYLDFKLYFILLSFMLGFFSYFFIERTRFFYINVFRVNVNSLNFTMILLIAFGLFIYSTKGVDYPIRGITNTLKSDYLKNFDYLHKKLGEYYNLECDMYHSVYVKHLASISTNCHSGDGENAIFLWGDSHAEALSFGIRNLNAAKFYQVTSANCKPSLSEDRFNKGDIKHACDMSNELALESIKKIIPKTVVMAQARKHEDTEWQRLIRQLHQLGVKDVILVGPVPQWFPSLPRIMIKDKNWNNHNDYVNDPGMSLSVIKTDEYLSGIFNEIDARYISLIDHLCKLIDGDLVCRVKDGDGHLLQVDYGHLSSEGSTFIVNNYLKEYIN